MTFTEKINELPVKEKQEKQEKQEKHMISAH